MLRTQQAGHSRSTYIHSKAQSVAKGFEPAPNSILIVFSFQWRKAIMGSHTTVRPTRKRSSPVSGRNEASSGDDSSPVKRRRSEETEGKETTEALGIDGTAKDNILAGRNVNSPGESAEAGIIKKIYVENFMCHRKFTLDLCNNVNFIHGQNGSGKSAILAAIQICLGAGAKRTHRARNLKELVRKDSNCANAKIQVTLLNKGEDGYQHDVYGDTITVERTIALRGGYNGYKLYDQDKNEVSRNKKDLDEMLDKLNIQVENPVAILDQEEAKKFLTGKAEDKYSFFMKATELERLDHTYASSLDMVEDLHNQAERLRGNLDTYISQAEEAERKWKETQVIERLETKCIAYEEMYAWALHKDADENLKLKRQERDIFQTKAQKKMEELTQAEAAQGPDDEETNRRNNLDELTQEANEQADRKQSLEVDLKRAVEPHRALTRQLKTLKKEIDAAKSNLNSARRDLENRRAEIVAKVGSAESEEAHRTQRIQDAERRYAAARQEREKLKQDVTDSRKIYDDLEPRVEQAKNEVRAVSGRLRGLEARMNELESASSNSLGIFGSKCDRVKQMVERTRFRGPVVGPIGAYVKIVAGKEKFASIAEFSLGNGTLDRFIVTNEHDLKIFQKIRREAGCTQDCGILLQQPFARYNIPPPPVEGIETVASVLQISDDLVFNCLVDSCKIEEKALSISKEESENLLLTQGNGGKYAIRGKIKTVFCLPKGDNWNVKNGTIGLNSNERRLRQTIGVDKSAAIAETRREVQSLKEDMENLRREESKLEHQHTESMKLWNKKKIQLRKNDQELDTIQRDIDALKEEEVSASNFDTDTSEFEQAVGEEEQALEALKEQESMLVAQIEERAPAIDDLKARLNEVKVRNEKVLEDMKAAEEELAVYVQNLSQKQEKLEKKRQKVKQYEEIIEKQDNEILDIDTQTNKYLLAARTLAFRRKKKEAEGGDEVAGSECSQDPTAEELEAIDIPDSSSVKDPKHYQTRLERMKKRIQQERERRNALNEDPHEVYEKYSRAKKQLSSKMEQINEIDSTSCNLSADLKKRKQRWRQFRQYISLIANHKFNAILNDKGSSGEIEFDHKSNRLDLCVQKDFADANSQQKDVKALSGGERSYTTIALLLAVGESLETPFRVLDEFDVFLDPVTRKLTIESLIKMATGEKMRHRQFIFITPQDVSNIATSKMLKIHKMKPPARGDVAGEAVQQTLDFSQT
eukprot:scaffold8259_cov143-Cylindrotheca_fusiformis.AAC.24